MSFDEEPNGDPHGECAAEIARLGREIAALRQPPADVTPRAWLIASKNGLVIRRTLLSEPTQEQRDCAAFDGDTITPLYDHPPAKSPADVAWLIESDEKFFPRWWTGEAWSLDVNEAIRFSRQIDAERVMVKQRLTAYCYFSARATQHEWVKQ